MNMERVVDGLVICWLLLPAPFVSEWISSESPHRILLFFLGFMVFPTILKDNMYNSFSNENYARIMLTSSCSLMIIYICAIIPHPNLTFPLWLCGFLLYVIFVSCFLYSLHFLFLWHYAGSCRLCSGFPPVHNGFCQTCHFYLQRRQLFD